MVLEREVVAGSEVEQGPLTALDRAPVESFIGDGVMDQITGLGVGHDSGDGGDLVVFHVAGLVRATTCARAEPSRESKQSRSVAFFLPLSDPVEQSCVGG